MIVSSSWGVLVAQRQRYRRVSETLLSIGVDHFIPLIETLLIVHGRHVREQRPLLGDYIPVAISSGWRSWMRIRGVRGMMLNELGFPAQVLPIEMDRLHEMCPNNIYHSSETVSGGFEYGQRVTPAAGPLVYQTGRYEGRANKRGDHAALFILFGREQRVVFKNGDLIAV